MSTPAAEAVITPAPAKPQPQPQTAEQISPKKWTPVFDPILGIDNLAAFWAFLYPEIPLYAWQKEELLRISGYITGNRKTSPDRTHHFHDNPYQAAYVCANGSGKDMALIATAALGLTALYRNVYVVITSSSYEQLKNQTENHIKAAVRRLNAKLGANIYDSVEFYHKCEERGAHIKLFVTDEAGRAEGWHPLTPDGLLVVIINEAKSISPEIMTAIDRCHGWSHWLEVSSPGPRRGMFYQNVRNAIRYPNLPELGRYFTRKVTADDCPHISKQSQQRLVDKYGENSFLVQTSLRANFWEEVVDVAIPIGFIESCEFVTIDNTDATYGAGLDCAAGNDETTLVIRKGNKILTELYFQDANTIRAADRVIEHCKFLLNYPGQYAFLYDDGGLGRTFGDALVRAGFDVRRVLNQSAANNKKSYLNLAAEMWDHVCTLFERRQIPMPLDPKLVTQLSTRPMKKEGNQGKKVLISKKLLRSEGYDSPDRADAYVLAYWSYRPGQPAYIPPTANTIITADQLLLELQRNPNYLADFIKLRTINDDQDLKSGRYTILNHD